MSKQPVLGISTRHWVPCSTHHEQEGYCCACSIRWPCDYTEIAAERDVALRDAERLRAALEIVRSVLELRPDGDRPVVLHVVRAALVDAGEG